MVQSADAVQAQRRLQNITAPDQRGGGGVGGGEEETPVNGAHRWPSLAERWPLGSRLRSVMMTENDVSHSSTADQLKTRLAAAADRGCSRVTTSRTPRAVIRLKPSLVPVSLHDGSNWQLTSMCSISVGQFIAPAPSERRPSVPPRSCVRSSGGAAAQTAARYQQRLCKPRRRRRLLLVRLRGQKLEPIASSVKNWRIIVDRRGGKRHQELFCTKRPNSSNVSSQLPLRWFCLPVFHDAACVLLLMAPAFGYQAHTQQCFSLSATHTHTHGEGCPRDVQDARGGESNSRPESHSQTSTVWDPGPPSKTAALPPTEPG